MNIAEISIRNVPAIAPGASLQEAAVAMRGAAAGVLPVTENGRLLGTLSERDLVVGGCASGRDPRRETIENIFDRRAAACPGAWHLRAALDLMRQRQETWLVVLDPDGAVAGAVSLVELLALLESLVPEEHEGPEPESVRRVRGENVSGGRGG